MVESVNFRFLLIFRIPGVTEPLSENTPPLPILQILIPPLQSPNWTESNVKPEKIENFWTGAGDNKHADFLAPYSLDDDTFGRSPRCSFRIVRAD